MRCPRCSADNLTGTKFCGQCGALLGVLCPSCGSVNPPEHRFCGQCGAPLDGPGLQEAVARAPFAPKPAAGLGSALPGEMKQVTVLFCDIVGSTALSARLDPEELREMLTTYQVAVAKEVAGKQGYVARFVGDGVLAYFGWPNTDEAHAESAVRAGLAIVEAVGHQQLPVRIGIATGLVVTGDLVGVGAAR